MSSITSIIPGAMTGAELLAAVKVGKRNLPMFNLACDEIDRRVARRNINGKPVTPPVAEALAVLARRNIAHVASTVTPVVKAEVVEAPAVKAEKVVSPEVKARRKATKAAEKAAAKLAEANGGQGYVRFFIQERKVRLAALDAGKFGDSVLIG